MMLRSALILLPEQYLKLLTSSYNNTYLHISSIMRVYFFMSCRSQDRYSVVSSRDI